MGARVTTDQGEFDIHTEARGPHWIGWLTSAAPDREGPAPGPVGAVVLVAATREDAEARARGWALRKTGR